MLRDRWVLHTLLLFVFAHSRAFSRDFGFGCVVQFKIAVHSHLAVAVSVILHDVACSHVVPEEGVSTENVVVVDLVGTAACDPASRWDL